MPQDPNEALLNPKPRVREFDDFFANQKARRALGATKVTPPRPAAPLGTEVGSLPITAPKPPPTTPIQRRAQASKGVIDAADDFMESIGGWDMSPAFVPDDDGKLISPRAKIIRNPEKAAMTLERIGGPEVVGDKNNPFWRRVEDASRAYSQAIATPDEQAMRGELQARTQALTATKQAGLQGMLKTAQAQTPISQREVQEKARTVTGIKESIIPQQPPAPPPVPQAPAEAKPTAQELPGQANLKGLIDDELFQSGSNESRTFAEIALDIGKDIGLDPAATQRALLVGQRTDPQKYNETLGAPADASKSNDISRFLLLALAFGAPKALQIVMSERQNQRRDAREEDRFRMEAERLDLDKERGDRDERRVTLAESEAAARERRWGETFNQREKLANMRSNIQILATSTASQDRNKAMKLRPFLAKLDSLSEQAKSQMMSPDAFLANPAVAETLSQMESILNE